MEEPRQGFSTFPIVGIGASAGGLEAYSKMLSALGADTGMAYVLVQHLDPHHESQLSEVLGKKTRMPVAEATQGMKVEPNHVYVIPPGSMMTLEKGSLHLSPRGNGHASHLTVDRFFKSLARDSRSRSIGIVLSGTGSDGTLGLLEIKAEGGITFAQDDASATHASMPRSAIDSGSVDFVLTPVEIARKLEDIGRQPYLAPGVSEPPLPPDGEVAFGRLLELIRGATGVDFHLYRDTTLKRRMLRRMTLHATRDLREYAALVERDPSELEALYGDLLINVTGFFRDPEVYESLSRRVWPEIVKGKAATQPIRIWCPGCSTGQEAYSVAMSLFEFFDDKRVRPPIQIFATDLRDKTSLEKARAGVYPESIEAEVGPERLRRFFRQEDHTYRIDKVIRDVCIFARQNLATDPPFSHIDLVSCRNVLIYMSPFLQKRVIPMFHYALNPDGFLLLGAAESVSAFGDLFETVDKEAKLYRRKPSARGVRLHFRPEDLQPLRISLGRKPSPPGSLDSDFQREADRILLSRFSPPGVLVNESGDIIQFRGATRPYLESPSGEPTKNILKMAREGLFPELRVALHEAKQAQRMVRRENLRVQEGSRQLAFDLEVVPIMFRGPETKYLVLFHPHDTEEATPAAHAPDDAEGTAADRDNQTLRHELGATKDYLHSLIEQQDAVNEELRSANEEILSSNEELQSTNEELETAKEELQSTNEELTTVNEQLHQRNREMAEANGDLTNLLGSIMIPVVMVGGDLRIRRFTPPAKRGMNLLPTDVGRPITDVKLNVDVPELESLIEEVIETVRPVEREVQDRAGRWNMLRIYPYRTVENQIDGAVIVLVDIDQTKRALHELELQMSLVDMSHDAIIVMGGDRRILSWNRGAEEMYGWSREEAHGKVTHRLLSTASDYSTDQVDAELRRSGTWEGQLQHKRKDGRIIRVHSRQVRVRGESGNSEGILEINRDITRQLDDERRVREQAEAMRQADRRKDEFLAVLAHELRNPLAPVRNAVRILRIGGESPELLLQAQDVLERQVEQLTRIVDDLLDMTRVAEGKIELRRERVKLFSIVQTAIESSRSLIEARGQKLNIEFPAEPLYLEADPVRIAQILINLLNNAAKFSERPGEIFLDIHHEAGPRKSPGWVVITVKDQGIGIAPELLPRMWEMFVQGDRTLERARGGLGVGLTLVRSLAEAHGGSVEARSAGTGKGSEFVVRLPLSAPPQAGETGGEAQAPAKRTPRRILVVDDNQDQAESLGMLLEVLGHRVRTAFDGPRGIEVARAFRPEVILLDIGLPGLNGYDVARRLRDLPETKDALMIAQTGWGEDDDRRRSVEAGFDHHFVKPVDIRALEQMMEKLGR